jgi:hypothetical protein
MKENDYDDEPACGYIRLRAGTHVYGDKLFIDEPNCSLISRPFSTKFYW